MPRPEIEIPQEAREVIQKLTQTGLVGKYATENKFVPMAVAEMVLTKDEMAQLDKIGSCSPEEWSEITGIKLGQQPINYQRDLAEAKKFLVSR